MQKRVALALVLLLAMAWAVAEFRFRESAGWDGELPVSTGAEDPGGGYQGDMLPAKRVAVAAAEMYFDQLFRNGGFENHAVSSVFFDAEDGVWIVGFREGGIGAGFEIALRKSDGAVLSCRGTE